jgi:hypothetical protein
MNERKYRKKKVTAILCLFVLWFACGLGGYVWGLYRASYKVFMEDLKILGVFFFGGISGMLLGVSFLRPVQIDSITKVLKAFAVLVISFLCLVSSMFYGATIGRTLDGGRTVADAGGDRTVEINEAITFNASGSCVGGAGIEMFSNALCIWDFDRGDGISVDAIGVTVNHTYTTTGTYTVTLIIVTYPSTEKSAAFPPNVVATDTVMVTVTE